jgi:2',3'-cyclic-nucleotide 2'-phosphodiesterase (5'-nucleotidase family)
LFTVLPFGNQTIVGDLTGAQIYDLLQQSATLFKGALQPSGLRYTFYSYTDTLASPAPQPYAWGAYSITVKNRANSLWEPLVMTKTYRVATNEFLAPAGGDGFSGFKYMTNLWYSGDDQLNGVLRWITVTYPISTPFNSALDGRIARNGTNTYNPLDPTQVVPVTVLHHNDPHGRLLDYVSGTTTYPGYTRLATLINQERGRNVGRTLLLNAGDTIQGDTMMAYYKTAFTGKASDGTTLPITLTTNPIIAAMNAMSYTAMTLGNHEFNFGHYIFTGTLKQATFPILQANLYDNGQYGLSQVPIKSDIAVTLPGPAGNIDVAVLGIGNHRIPQYEMAIDIPGLTFTNPITEAQNRVPALKAANDAVVALTHIGFTTDPSSIEVDNNVDTYLAAQTAGVDTIIGGHSHTDPSRGQAPYKYLPSFVGSPDNTPVLINQAYRYNNYLGQVVLGLLPDGSGGYDVVSRAGRYIKSDLTVAEDATIKALVKPYDDFLTTYKNQVFGQTLVPIDTLTAFTQETNGANLQVDASLWKLNKELSPTIHVDFHLSGAMTNAKIAASATATNPYTMTVGDMFTLMPYENALVVFRLNGPQLKTILERGYRNYYYYKYVPGQGGYSYYPTCMLDINKGGQITYHDTYPTLPNGNNVAGLRFGGHSVNFLDATTYYTVSTVNYIAAGSCNFNDSSVTLWPPSQLVASTQYYVRDVVIEYVPTLPQPIAPTIEGRLQFLKFVYLPIIRR